MARVSSCASTTGNDDKRARRGPQSLGGDARTSAGALVRKRHLEIQARARLRDVPPGAPAAVGGMRWRMEVDARWFSRHRVRGPKIARDWERVLSERRRRHRSERQPNENNNARCARHPTLQAHSHDAPGYQSCYAGHGHGGASAPSTGPDAREDIGTKVTRKIES